MVDEGSESLLLTKELIDRALMARLMLPPKDGLQWPLPYLLSVYSKASNELRRVLDFREKAAEAQIRDAAAYAQELAVSHTLLALTLDIFPQVTLSQLV